jgi:cation diffusion facilitator family transporter
MSREKAQIVSGIVSVVGNAVLFAIKFAIGLTTGSIALMADAWHTMSDSLTSVFTVVAAKLAAKKPDKEHPFGHGRWELIASIIMAGILAIIGWEFISRAFERLTAPEHESTIFGTAALVVTIVSILVKELMAQYGFYLGKKHKNPVIIADAWHSRTDSLSSVAILIGIIVTKFVDGLWWMDSVLAIICALAIFWAAFEIGKEVVSKILGEVPTQDFIDELNAQARELHVHDLELHHIHLHNYITHKELTLHIKLEKDMTIEQGHDIATVIENMILERFGMDATIHVEPIGSSDGEPPITAKEPET